MDEVVLPQKAIRPFINCFCYFLALCKTPFVAVRRKGCCLAVFKGEGVLALCKRGAVLIATMGRNTECCAIPCWLCQLIIKCFARCFGALWDCIRELCDGIGGRSNAFSRERSDVPYTSLPRDDRERLERYNREKYSIQHKLDESESEKRGLLNKMTILEKKLKVAEQAKDEAMRRLSEHVSLALADNNPNIADLSDLNRPTNLAEKFSTLYDDEWTEALESLANKTGTEDETKAIQMLLAIVEDCFKLCREQSSLQLKELTAAYNMTMETAPKELLKLTKDARKKHAHVYLGKVQQAVLNHFTEQYAELLQYAAVKAYIMKCTELCWLMGVQDPPMAISSAVGPDNRHDKRKYREYTTSGQYVEYVVWPCVLIQDGGHLMSKGIAQCHDKAHTIISVE